MATTKRIVVLIDMDCFYVQVEERDNPMIKGKPAAVVQYNKWKGGGIIAVNYEARSYGVKRGMRGEEARAKCPNIHLVTVPVQRGKADLTKYRNAGSEVISVLCQFSDSVERASVDEAYIDFTKTIDAEASVGKQVSAGDLPFTWVQGYSYKIEDEDQEDAREESVCSFLSHLDKSTLDVEGDKHLSLAAAICEKVRSAVFDKTGFKCSAGISHNKMLSKLSCGLHKPNQQTILPMSSVPALWTELAVGKIRNLGGKLGESLSSYFNVTTMGQLSDLSENRLRTKYDEKTANWLWNLGRGIDNEHVTARLLPKSIGCGKNFIGKDVLDTKEKVNLWMGNLTEELSERLTDDQEQNKRIARNLTVHIRQEDGNGMSRSTSLHSYEAEFIAKLALNLIQHTNAAQSKVLLDKWTPAITNISLSAGKFEKSESSSGNIEEMFKNSSSAVIQKFKPPPPIKPRLKSFFESMVNKNSTRKSFDLSVGQFSSKESSTAQQISEVESPAELHVNEATRSNLADQSRDLFEASIDEGSDEEDTFRRPQLPPVSSVEEKKCIVYETQVDEDEELIADISSFNPDEGDSVKSPPSSPIMKRVVPTKNSFFLAYKEMKEIETKPQVKSNLNFDFDKKISKLEEDADDPPAVAGTSDDSQIVEVLPEETCSDVDIEDIFPDLSRVDESTLSLLPSSLQLKVKRAVKKYQEEMYKRSSQEPKKKKNKTIVVVPDIYTVCDLCGKKMLRVEAAQHADFHFAVNLRKEQIHEFRASRAKEDKKSPLGSPTQSPAVQKKSSKRGRKHSFTQIDSIKVARIDSFFKKS